MSSETKRTIIGILWICSGLIILIGIAILSVLINFSVTESVEPVVDNLDSVDSQTNSGQLLYNIFSWIMGLVGVVMLVLGPIIGIKVLSKSNNQQ